MTINSKVDLYSYYEEKMNKSYKEYKSTNKSAYENTLLKSYILEAHIPDGSNNFYDNSYLKLKEIIEKKSKSIKVIQTKDDCIISIKDQQLELFIEFYDKRFWYIHTMSKSTNSDNFIKILLHDCCFDRFWIPSKMFRRFLEKSNVYGMNVKFQDSFTEDKFFTDEQQEFTFKATKGEVNELLDLFSSSPIFKNKIAINKLSILGNHTADKFIIDDIKHDGKVTARGNSIDYHVKNLASITQDYKKVITYMESKMSLHFDDSGLKGVPIEILLTRKNIDLTKLVKLIFSPGSVFKLWGIPEWINDGYVRVQAVDLHTGNKGNRLNFELTCVFIRVYLPDGTCGNSVMRLITNLNCYVDALTEVRGFDIDDIFSII